MAQLHATVVNGRERVDDDVANAARVLDSEPARELLVVRVAHVALRDRVLHAADALKPLRVRCVDHRFGIEAGAPAAVVDPAVVATLDVAVLAPALAQSGGAVATAVFQRGGLAVFIKEMA
ncbi:hypothetical protein D9M68_794300 [compost metagenome]